MGFSRKTISISARNDLNLRRQIPQKKKSKKPFFFLILFLLIFIPLFFLFNNLEAFRTINIGLNEMEIRYDTFSVSFTELIPEELKEEIQS